MKYWVYKDSRILGPFDKSDVAGLPGLDASTLVCAGDSAAAGEGDWRPAGDVADLAALPLDRGAAWSVDVPSSMFGLLDKLQLDVAGLIGDGEFPGAAEDLFQDADMKRTFGDLLAPRPRVDEAELRRAKDRAVELTTQLELLYKRVAELEAGQANLAHRLAEKELQLRSRPAADAVPPVESFLREAETAPVPPSAVPRDWPSVAGGEAFPSFPSQGSPAPAPPAPPPPLAPMAFPAPVSPPPEAGPPLSADRAAPPPPAILAEPLAADPPALESPPKKGLFERKTFKVVPTVKAFKVVGAEANPVAGVPSAPEAVFAPAVNAFDWGASASAAPEQAPEMTPPTPAPTASMPAPAPAQAPTSTPAPVPPVTLSFGAAAQPEPASSTIPFFPGAAAAQEPFMPSYTDGFKGADDMAGAPSTEEALARLAKPEPAPTGAPRAPRSNKPFVIGGAALVVVMAVVGSLFLRHPKDLKQMTELDDGRARVGAEPADDASRLPMVKPKMAVPAADVAAAPQAPAAGGAPAGEAPQAASSAKLDAAVAAVKDFPLDGERGTVAQWLQFSYSASPDAGKESWSASETADKTYLVEYRFTPSGRGDEVHYLFEADMDRGLVIGKNMDAKSVLAGGPRVVAEKARPKAKPRRRKKPAKRAADDVAPKDMPLLPLPDEGELRPPAEDDGAFSADTVNSGL